MAEIEPGQVPATVPKGRAELIWSKARGKLGEMTGAGAAGETAGLLADTTTGVGVVRASAMLVGLISAEDDSLGARAYELLGRALLLTVVQLGRNLAKQQHADLKQSIDLLAPDTIIDRSFFDRPDAFPLVDIMRRELANTLAGVSGDANAKYEAFADFPDWFHRHVVFLYAENQSRYLPLHGATEGPFVDAWNRKVDWKNYSTNVIQQEWSSPLFGRNSDFQFGLKDVYIPLRATVRTPKAKDSDKSDDEVRSLRDDHDETEHPLREHFARWLEDRSNKADTIRLVTGGPGCGKSSFMKALAFETDQKRRGTDDWHVIFVPLHKNKFRFDGSNLTASICACLKSDGFEDRHQPFSSDRMEPLLFLFDGLDELAMPDGPEALDQAQRLVSAVEHMLQEIAGGPRRRQVRAVISGRWSVMENLVKPGDVPIGGLGIHQLYRVAHYSPEERVVANEHYAKALNLKVEQLPAALRDDQYEHLSREPLLHAFMALSYNRQGRLDPETTTRAHIYNALFGDMFDREVKGGKPAYNLFYRDGDTKAKTEDRFFLAMETIALAAYRGTDFEAQYRSAARDKASEALTSAGLDGLLDKAGTDVSSLAATFFTRKDESGGVEFHHKSFGEYLYARRLVRWVNEYAQDIEAARVGNPKQAMIDAAFTAWLPLADAHRLSFEVLDFLKGELLRCSGSYATAKTWNTALLPVVERALVDGWQEGSSQRETERRSVNAEEALFCTWRWLVPPEAMAEGEHWSFPNADDRLSLFRLLHRSAAVHGPVYVITRTIGIGSNSLTLESLQGADLMRADLTGANLTGADLMRRGPDGREPDGRGPDGREPDGRGPDGRGPDGREPDGRGPDGRGPDGR